MFNRIFNEIFIEERSSFNWYDDSAPYYLRFPGKIHSQELHHWNHWASNSKWHYDWKDRNLYWYHFYTPLHNPTSTGEKIINLYYYWIAGDAANQLWTYIKLYNRL